MTVTNEGIVREAAEILARNGWCQHTYEDGLGRNCAGGALRRAWGGGIAIEQPLPDPVARALIAAVTEQFPERIGTPSVLDGQLAPLVKFNDHKDTTLADVIAVLEKAAVQLG